MKRKIMQGFAFSLLLISLTSKATKTVYNHFGKTVTVRTNYKGATSFSCRPDVMTIANGDSADFYPGGCILSSIGADGGWLNTDPHGDTFTVLPDGQTVNGRR